MAWQRILEAEPYYSEPSIIRNLRPATLDLLSDSKLFGLEQGKFVLKISHHDLLIFKSVIERIICYPSTPDDLYRQIDLPHINNDLDETSIFQFLASGNILTTETNTERPAMHIKTVAQVQRTDGLVREEVILQRLADYLHDIGKAVGAHLDRDTAKSRLQAKGYTSGDSFPNHALISVMATDQILNFPPIAKLIADLGPDFKERLLLLIRDHHLLHNMDKDEIASIASPAQKIHLAERVSDLIAFANADILAVNVKFWAKNLKQAMRMYGEMLQMEKILGVELFTSDQKAAFWRAFMTVA